MKLRQFLDRITHINFVVSLYHSSVAWTILYAHAAVQFTIFSIPSHGWPVILIPMFAGTACLLIYSLFTRKLWYAVAGGLTFTVAAILRAIALLGVSQDGAGNDYLASSVWLWIAMLSACYTLTVYYRGFEPKKGSYTRL